MLNAAVRNSMRAAHELAISSLGSPVTYRPVAGGSFDIVVGFKTVGVNDVELVNAYGIGAKIITVRQIDLPVQPKKFDVIEISGTGEKLTASTVSDVHLNGELIAYKLSTAGK